MWEVKSRILYRSSRLALIIIHDHIQYTVYYIIYIYICKDIKQANCHLLVWEIGSVEYRSCHLSEVELTRPDSFSRKRGCGHVYKYILRYSVETV